MLPSSFVVLSALPRNANGKIDRNALEAPPVSRSRRLADWAALLEETRSRGSLSLRADLAGLHAHMRVFRANTAALEAYRPRPYAGRVALVQAMASGDELGRRWRDLVTGPFEAHVLPGNHFSLMREGVQDLALRLGQALADLRQGT